ncbi:spore germination protein [Paraclostridium sordellii]|uniref:spore germination protein n=1 Tax=Paraclostridium sordellii TaxID=1505 RepID=UPI0005DDFAD5|nr:MULTISPECIES: spore germination protein [Paeniclostridium]MBW4864201.1 spore germination protein [Paeniclostridium sp.]CEN22816.1 stage V sporulation protein AF [[Clostridium] sordellii] [Paeniclostridium sordellii]CEN95595.1 stage V sporulation protein AF [[Clostridium] sordellii] [Paeniclostridium sordellii]
MILTKNIHRNVELMKEHLPLDKSFDVIQREVTIGGKSSYLFFIDGFIKDDVVERILSGFFQISPEDFKSVHELKDFIHKYIPYIEVAKENKLKSIAKEVLSGPMAILIDGFDEAIILDVRTYPVRGIEEPEKEKALKGSKDGFVETIVFNTALVRRRIKDPSLIFEMFTVGKRSQTDVVIGYIDGLVDKKTLKALQKHIDEINVKSLVMSEQSIVEAIVQSKWYNPFPKARYTERPDVAAAHILEGKILLIIDNSPSAIILPTTIFDFLQDVDDFYQPVIIGNYLRLIRNFTLMATLLITPLYTLAVKYAYRLPVWLEFIIPKDPYDVPIFLQFLILEFSIDALQLASLNTPGSLGMSLSVVGALILGDFAVQTGWFIPHTILYMAIVALGSYSQPSIDLGYSIKIIRILLLTLTAAFNIWGFIAGLIITFALLATNKTITGKSYLYPLIPFEFSALKRLIFRVKLDTENEGK